MFLNSLPGFNKLQICQILLPHGRLPRSVYRQSISSFSKLIYYIMPLDYRKLHVEVWVKLVLTEVTFVHAATFSLIYQKQYAKLGENLIRR